MGVIVNTIKLQENSIPNIDTINVNMINKTCLKDNPLKYNYESNLN